MSKVLFPEGNLFGALEVLESYPTDTIRENFNYHLVKKYGLTQWDSGSYILPRLQITINDKAHFSDSLLLEFTPVAVDTLKQHMYDIKDIAQAEGFLGNWWMYVLSLLLLIGLGYLVYVYLKKNQKPKEEVIVYATPIEKATAHLKKLEQQHLVERGEVKAYYSELTDIARTYIEETIDIPAMESTTAELIDSFKKAIIRKKLSLTGETISNLEKVLKQADLVKFAKSKPLEFEIAEDRTKIEKTIFKIHQSLPDIEEEEDEFDDSKSVQERLAKKKRKQQIVLASFISVFLLFAVFIFFVATKGVDFVKDSIIGNPTKELLNGEWVTSEYGDPPVRIETPKVLVRLDDSEAVLKGQSPFKEAIRFGYGGLTDDFYINVMTTKLKDSVEIDLQKIVESNMVHWEKMGAQNILVKTETHSSEAGVDGIRAFGTLVFLDGLTKKSTKLYYEMLLFKQNKGMQQIIVSKLEDDELGGEIIDRIIKSVELGKLE